MKLFLTVFISLIFLPASLPQNNFTQLDKYLDSAAAKNVFSGVVVIAEGDSIIYEKGAGYADWDNLTPLHTDTKFNIGSIGKLLTGIMVMQLVQEGKLELDAPLKSIGTFYGNEYDEKITPRQLMHFSAGTGDYFRIPEYRQNPMAYKEVKDLASLILKQPLLFEPGTSNEYSNSGYVLLGSIIEKLSGKSYEENLKERILGPLEMNNTMFIYPGDKKENTAEGYIVNFRGEKEDAGKRVAHVPSPAGGIYSNAKDLLKLNFSLVNDNLLLADKYKAEMFSEPGEKNVDWSKLKNSSNAFAGGSPGWNSILGMNTASKYTVIILSNYPDAAEALFSGIQPVFTGGEPKELKKPIGMLLFETMQEKGNDYLAANYKKLFADKGYTIEDDRQLNQAGYEFLNSGMTPEAITVFKINTELFPETGNTYDSLGEAYLKAGDKKAALENYQKAAELDPGNGNARKMIEELR